eukprot:4000418-Alexandrium_andersonii.AAC.1
MCPAVSGGWRALATGHLSSASLEPCKTVWGCSRGRGGVPHATPLQRSIGTLQRSAGGCARGV